MKKLLGLSVLCVLVSACNIFGGGDDEGSGSGSGGGSRPRGVFHPGPYHDPETGKFCNPPGGYCEGDKRCHSSPDKCPAG